MAFVSTLRTPAYIAAIAASALAAFGPSRASAEAMLLIEADTGKVLHAENATYPWYPASVTKVMTAYVTLQAIKTGRLTLDSLLTVSARAAAQQPSKMGFKPGTQVTVDNALKMLMVKSANDIAVVLAEGVSGSVEKFSDEMNATSRRLGMTQSSWVNPNGLPADGQISSARDLAILARATLREFPEYEPYWHVSAIKFGKKTMRNTNTLLGRYTGADGMKTGFICASGFNLVASASRRGKRLIAVVLGAPSSPYRAVKAAALLERGFNGNGLSWLAPSLGTVDQMAAIDSPPPDLREEMCGKHRKRPAAEDADEDVGTVADNTTGDPNSPQAFMLSSLPPSSSKPSSLLGPVVAAVNPIVVYAGAARKVNEPQFAALRAKLAAGKTAKADTTKPDAKAKPAPAAAQVATAPAAAPAQTVAAAPVRQVASATPPQAAAAPAGQFGPPPGQFTPTSRSMPAAVESRWMSFAPAAQAAPAVEPLTAVPTVTGASAAPRVASVPMPRPQPKTASKH